MENMNDKINCKSCSKEPTGRVNIGRFISKLDEAFRKNDLEAAEKTVEYWQAEAESLGDDMGLLSILNEELGLYRRLNNSQKATAAIEKTKALLDGGFADTVSGATICINLATTLKAFGRPQEAVDYYNLADKVYNQFGLTKTYEYAALLNNKSSTLIDLELFYEAEEALNKAIELLKDEGKHDADISLSYLSLAHLTFDRDETAFLKIEGYLDLAWEYINSPRQKRDSDWAFAISKCIPSFKYFKRELEAEVLAELVEEIYGGKI